MPEFDKLLNRLVLARKHIQFYPPNSPIVAEALAALEKDFESVFAPSADAASSHSGGAAPAGPETFRLEVGCEGFIVDGAPVATENDAVNRFANDLFKLGLKQLIFQAGVVAEDLRRFFDVLSRPADKIKAEGGIEEAIKAASLSNIHVERPETLEMVTLDEIWPTSDLAEPLRQGGHGGDAGGTAVHGELDALDLADFFEDLASDDPELRQKLVDALANPEQLAQIFNAVHKGRKGPHGEGGFLRAATVGEGLSQQAMRKILKSISRKIGSLPPDKRSVFLENIAEAVLASNWETRDELLRETLAQGIGERGIEEEVVAFLSKEHIADVLSSHATLHKGTADTILNYLAHFVADTDAQTSLAETVADILGDGDSERLCDIARLLKKKDLEEPQEQPKVSRGDPQKRDQLSKGREELVEELALSEENMGCLRSQMEEDCGDASYAHAGAAALAVHKAEGMPLLTPSSESFLERSLAVSLHSGQYGDASRLLAAMAEECKHEDEAQKGYEGLEGGEAAGSSAGRKALFEGIKEKTCAGVEWNRVMVVFEGLRRQREGYEDLLGCVHGLGDPAVHALVEEYGREQDPSVRKTYVEFFREVGEGCTRVLQDRVNKALPGWLPTSSHRDTLCETIGLAGELGAFSGLAILEPLVYHSDPHVRQAALTALSKIQHERVETALLHAIADPDPAVGIHAAQLIEQLRVQNSLPALTQFLRMHRKDFRKESARYTAIARAIGSMGGIDELAVLKEIMPSGIFGWLRGKDPVKDEFRSAVVRIKRRIKVKRV